MSGETSPTALTGSLQDYLETIYEVVRERKVARVRDIAQARSVRAASVTPAMRRLAEMGLIRYVRREFIEMTPSGEAAARRVLARHHLLARFLEGVLSMRADAAERDACAMEHSLSDEGVDHLVRFFEFLQVCPDGEDFLRRFHGCPLSSGKGTCTADSCAVRPGRAPSTVGPGCAGDERAREEASPMTLSELKPGERGRVRQVMGRGALRRRLLDMGLLPDVAVEVMRDGPSGEPMWIRLEGFELSLRRAEARSVLVERV